MSNIHENETQSSIKIFGDFIRNTDYKDGDISDKIKNMALSIPLDSVYESKISSLILTIYYNYSNVFDILLSRGFDINNSYDMFNQMNPLMWAIEKNNEYMIERLLSFENIDLFFKNKNNENILFFMGIHMTNISLFKRIVDKMIEQDKNKFIDCLNSKKCSNGDKYNTTKNPVYCCIQYLDQYDLEIKDLEYHKDLTLQKIKIYLDTLYNIDKKLVDYYKHLFYDFITTDDYSFVINQFKYFTFCLYEYLKSIGVYSIIKGAISWSVHYNNIYLLHQFIHDGYDINEFSVTCGTPLNYAIIQGNNEMVRHLLGLGPKNLIIFKILMIYLSVLNMMI